MNKFKTQISRLGACGTPGETSYDGKWYIKDDNLHSARTCEF